MGNLRGSGRRLAGVLVAASLAVACSSDGAGDAVAGSSTTTTPPSTAGGGPTRAVDPASLPDTSGTPRELEVVYRVEALGGDELGVETERRLARLPFEARVEVRTGAPDDAALEPRLVDIEVLGGSESGAPDGQRVLVVVPPRPATRAPVLRTDLPAAVAAGIIEPVGRARTILGRTCLDLRTGAVLDAGVLQAPTGTAHVDVCVATGGVVLREEQVRDGEVVEVRTAVSVDDSPAIAADAFAPLGWRLPEERGGGRVRRITADSRPPGVGHYDLAVPADFAVLGRFGLATDTAPGPSPIGPVDRLVAVADVLVRGADALVGENGGTERSGDPFATVGVPVGVDFAAPVHAIFLPGGVELRSVLGGGRYVRIVGTIGLDQLVELVRSLSLLDGPGSVVPFDDEEDVTGRLRPTGDDDHDHAGTGADHDHGDLEPDDHRHD